MTSRLRLALCALPLLVQTACGDDHDAPLDRAQGPSSVPDAALVSPTHDSGVPPGIPLPASPTLDASASGPLDAGRVAELDAARPALPSDADGGALPADGYLLVAELADGMEAIHVYSLPDLRHTGQLDDVKLAGHMGTLVLRDGRVITADDKRGQIIAIGVDAMGRPSLVNRVDADLGEEAVWACGDKDLRYLAVSSAHEGAQQVANIVDLSSFALTKFGVSLNVVDGATEELHPAIAGNPLHLFASVGSEVRAWPLADVLAGSATTPVVSIPIHPGSHGPLLSHETGVLYIATRPGAGFDGVAVAMPFARTQLIPWDVDGLSTGRNARPRLSFDAHYIYGAIAATTPEGPERWAERAADFHATDVHARTARRSSLTTGLVSKFQLSSRYALFANVTGDGSTAILLDVSPGSSTFHQVVARIPLGPLGQGPRVGEATTGKETLGSAITPDGKWAFVSHGGDGKVSVIDTAKRAVVRVLETPTPLRGGGYLLAFQPGVVSSDTCAR